MTHIIKTIFICHGIFWIVKNCFFLSIVTRLKNLVHHSGKFLWTAVHSDTSTSFSNQHNISIYYTAGPWKEVPIFSSFFFRKGFIAHLIIWPLQWTAILKLYLRQSPGVFLSLTRCREASISVFHPIFWPLLILKRSTTRLYPGNQYRFEKRYDCSSCTEAFIRYRSYHAGDDGLPRLWTEERVLRKTAYYPIRASRMFIKLNIMCVLTWGAVLKEPVMFVDIFFVVFIFYCKRHLQNVTVFVVF